MLVATAAAATPAAGSATVGYVVRQGDNLSTVAARYFERTDDFAIVRKLNRIADPYRLRVGSTLRIPRGLLRQEMAFAKVENFSGPVLLVTAGRSGTPTAGMPIGETGSIETGANAFLTLRLADGSTVSIPSQSHVTISRMRRVVMTGAVERQFDIQSGRARAVVTHMTDEGSGFRLATPVAVAAVRGTQFQVGYDSARGTDTTEVLEGNVGVTATQAQSTLPVPAGFGTLATASGAPALVKLPAAPMLADPGRIQNGTQLAFMIVPVAEAAAYHVVVARDADSLDQIEELQSPTVDAILPSLPTGTYFARVSAIDRNGLEGEPSTYGFERRLNSVDGSMQSSGRRHDRRYQFRWDSQGEGAHQFRFQISTNADGNAPFIDEVGLTQTAIVLTNLPSGDYYWRVMSVQFADGKAEGAWMPIHHFHIEAR